MFRTFYPKEYVDSTYIIDFDEFAKKGYKGVIFDVDNTLVPHGAPADDRAKALFAHVRSDIHIDCIKSLLLSALIDLFIFG